MGRMTSHDYAKKMKWIFLKPAMFQTTRWEHVGVRDDETLG